MTKEKYWERIDLWQKNICEFLKNKEFENAENENDWFGWELCERNDFTQEDWEKFWKIKGWWLGVNDVLMAINGTSLGVSIDVDTGNVVSLDNSLILKDEME